MNIFNLRAVGEHLKLVISNYYNNYLNKIATHSRIYKELYNRVQLNEELSQSVDEFRYILNNSRTTKAIKLLYETISPSILEKFDYDVVRQSEKEDLLVVSSENEKFKVLQVLKMVGTGQVVTIDEFLQNLKQYPINTRPYIFSSVWIKDQTRLINLLYKIENYSARYKLWFT